MALQNYDEIRSMHYKKRCEILKNLVLRPQPFTPLNSALLDKDKKKIKAEQEKLIQQNLKFRLTDVADVIRNKSRLRILYLLPFNGMTGGVKILIQQANSLAEKGHDVLMYSHCPRPEWISCKTTYIHVPPEADLSDAAVEADVVIAGYWDLVTDALRIKAPLKYHLAQGDFDIFEFRKQASAMQSIITAAYSQPLRILTVSGMMKGKIEALFGRKSLVIPNAVDRGVFHLKEDLSRESDPLQILLVGSDTIKFKGHDTILGALYCLKGMGYRFNLRWLTQVPLQGDYGRMGFTIEEYVAPPQETVGELYRNSDIYICGSTYEAFGLPVLEAMSCGAAVISSDNGGIRDFGVDGANCLIFEPGNARMLTEKLQTLLDDPGLRHKLRMNAAATAKRYTWARSSAKLDRELKKAAESTMQALKN